MYHIETLKRKNSKRYTKILDLETINNVVSYLMEHNIKATGTPYIFTRINLDNGDIITQDINGIIVSPKTLAEILLK